MKSMRELAVDGMRMRDAGKQPSEIRAFIFREASALALRHGTQLMETGDDRGWEMRLVSNGQIIAYSESGGYSYRPN